MRSVAIYIVSSLLTTACKLQQCLLPMSMLLSLLHSQVGKAANVLDAIPLRIDAQLPRPEYDDLVLSLRCFCLELPRWHRLESNLQTQVTLKPT